MGLHFKRQSFYYRHLHRRRRLLKTGIFIALLLVIVVAGAVFFLWSRRGSSSPPDTSAHTTTINYQPFTTFTTDYFTFQADKDWQAVPAETTPTSFVYRELKKNLVERDLTIYVNQLPPRLMLTYILPVDVTGNEMKTGDVSQHCRTSLPADYLKNSRNPKETTMGGVNFLCWADSASVTIGTGQRGGSYQVSLSHGQIKAQYFLLYHDLAYNPRPEIFKQLVGSFQSR